MTKRTAKLIIAVLMILAVCLYFIAGTYARYTSSITGNAKVDVAKWAVAFKNGDATLANDFNLTFTVDKNNNVVSNKIAPATTATATITVDLTGTEVAVDFKATVDETKLPTQLQDVATVKTSVSGVEGNSTTVNLVENKAFTADNGKITLTVTLTWEDKNTPAYNATDTALGTDEDTTQITIPVTITAEQHIG